MTNGDIVLNAQNGRYAIFLATTGSGMASVCQIQIHSTGDIEKGSRTTWRMGVVEYAELMWLTPACAAWARQGAKELAEVLDGKAKG